MSSILKALKKLEQENIRQSGTVPWPQARTAPLSGTQAASKTRSVVNVLVLLLCAAMLGMSSWFMLAGSPTPPLINRGESTSGTADSTTLPNRMPAGEETAVAGQAASAAGGRDDTPPSEVNARPTAPASPSTIVLAMIPSEQAPAAVTPEPEITALPAETGSPATISQPTGYGLPADRQAQDIPLSATNKSQTGPATTAIPAAKTQPDLSAALPENPAKRIADSILKLQAITWAPQANKRFAVINNRIVRPGEGIDGYLIARIDKDFVTVRKNDETWEVRFRPR